MSYFGCKKWNSDVDGPFAISGCKIARATCCVTHKKRGRLIYATIVLFRRVEAENFFTDLCRCYRRGRFALIHPTFLTSVFGMRLWQSLRICGREHLEAEETHDQERGCKKSGRQFTNCGGYQSKFLFPIFNVCRFYCLVGYYNYGKPLESKNGTL
jgi:hypothetical protein